MKSVCLLLALMLTVYALPGWAAPVMTMKQREPVLMYVDQPAGLATALHYLNLRLEHELLIRLLPIPQAMRQQMAMPAEDRPRLLMPLPDFDD